MKPSPVFRYVHLGALALAAIALPWSEFLLSNALIILLANWIWEGAAQRDLGGRFRRAFTDPACAVWLSFFGLHLLGLLWTTDLEWGVDLCRILLPIPILGLVLGSSPRLSAAELRYLLLLGAWSVVGSTLACIALRYEALGTGDYRALSPFISHIRLGLMLCFSAATFVHHWPARPLFRAAHIVALLWIVTFLVLLSSITGLIIGAVLMILALLRHLPRRRPVFRVAVVVGLVLATIVLYRVVSPGPGPVTDAAIDHLDALEANSAGGEPYYHDRERPQLENGHYVWVNIADGELERGWNARSRIPFRSKDANGLPIRTALVRYLSSMGLRKDSVALAHLTAEDVERIEAGITSIRTGRVSPLQSRWEQVVYEWNTYRSTGSTSGHSITMRMVFQHTGLSIAKRNLLFGVGTGDTQQAFNEAYANEHSTLEARWRLRAHDQYLTWCISFGLLGLLWCLFAWSWPAWRMQAAHHPLFLAWAIIAGLSCLTEDTLETQMGATFAALYYALFVFAAPFTARSST